jgi:hypothetical protein
MNGHLMAPKKKDIAIRWQLGNLHLMVHRDSFEEVTIATERGATNYHLMAHKIKDIAIRWQLGSLHLMAHDCRGPFKEVTEAAERGAPNCHLMAPKLKARCAQFVVLIFLFFIFV